MQTQKKKNKIKGNYIMRMSGIKLKKGGQLTSRSIANSYQTAGYADSEFIVIHYSDSNGKNIGGDILTIGTENQGKFEMIRLARLIHLNKASAIIMMHNHPSGSSNASMADIHATKQVNALCNTLNIDFIDHVIVGHSNWYSFKKDKQYKYRKRNSNNQKNITNKNAYRFIDFSDKLTTETTKLQTIWDIADYYKNFDFKKGKEIIFLYKTSTEHILCSEKLEFKRVFSEEFDKSEFTRRLLDVGSSALIILSYMPERVSLEQWSKHAIFTRQLAKTCMSIGVSFQDHLSLGAEKWFSLAHEQMFLFGYKPDEKIKTQILRLNNEV